MFSKTTVLALFLVIILGSPASAQRHQTPCGPQACAPVSQDWSGPYVGFFQSSATGDWHRDGFAKQARGSGFGATAGANVQREQFVCGIYGDIESTKVSSSFTNAFNGFDGGGNPFSQTSTMERFVEGSGGVGLLLGISGGSFMPFVKGGLMLAQVRDVNTNTFTGVFSGSTNSFATTTLQTGSTIGGGVEYRFARRVSGVAEYRHTQLQQQNGGIEPLQLDEVRVGANIRF